MNYTNKYFEDYQSLNMGSKITKEQKPAKKTEPSPVPLEKEPRRYVVDGIDEIFAWEVEEIDGKHTVSCKDLDLVMEGEFQEGKLHGVGKMQKGIAVYEGQFVRGKLISGKISDLITGNMMMEGSFLYYDGGYHCHGSSCKGYINGKLRKEGTFWRGFLQEGSLYRPDGSVGFRGTFRRGKPHCGTNFDLSGKPLYTGQLNEDGEYDGIGVLYFGDFSQRGIFEQGTMVREITTLVEVPPPPPY